jgi:hypothetical protein
LARQAKHGANKMGVLAPPADPGCVPQAPTPTGLASDAVEFIADTDNLLTTWAG